MEHIAASLSQNLLVDTHWTVKCGDFGLSREVFDQVRFREYPFYNAYMYFKN